MAWRLSNNNRMHTHSKMKKIFFITLLSLFTLHSSICMSQTADETKITQQISKAAASMKSMQCDFTQTKHMKMLNHDMVSKGKMHYQQTNMLRWEYTSPYTYTFILNDKKVMLKKGNRQDVIDVNRNKIFSEIARLMMNTVIGKCLDGKDFKTSIAKANNSYIATLFPTKKDMRQMFQKIVIHFNASTCMVNKVTMHEKNGDSTDIILYNIVTNKTIPVKTFTW